MAECRIDLEAMEWTQPIKGVRFKCYSQGGRQLRLVEFSKGFVEPDWCVNGHIGYVLEGMGRLELASGTVALEAGDGIFIPAGQQARHKLTVLSDVVRVVLVEDAAT